MEWLKAIILAYGAVILIASLLILQFITILTRAIGWGMNRAEGKPVYGTPVFRTTRLPQQEEQRGKVKLPSGQVKPIVLRPKNNREKRS